MVQLPQSVSLSKAPVGPGIKWWLLLQFLIVVPALAGLGFWQLDRADQKQALLQQWQQAEFKALDEPLQEFDRVQLSGALDQQRYLLLDNQIREGVAGYEVVGLLRSDNAAAPHSLLLVALGWVPVGMDRQRLPALELPGRLEAIPARLDHPDKGLVLAEEQWSGHWPERIQQLDRTRIAEHLGESLSPWLLRPEVEPLTGKMGNWKPVVMPPEKHLGYAVQWFALALAWCAMSGWLARRSLAAQKEAM